MLEILFCSMLTILPDFLIRRFVQGKRIGKEITLYTVFYELRIGITACILLAVLLITTIFYNHPSTKYATLYYRSVPILPEASGRVAEVYIAGRTRVQAGEPLFRLDTAAQEAAAATAKSRIAEITAQLTLVENDIAAAQGQVDQAQANATNASQQLEVKKSLSSRSSTAVSNREIEQLQNSLDQAIGALNSANATLNSAIAKRDILLPAQLETAKAQLVEAETAIEKGTIRAGVSGLVEQFSLRVGDLVNPVLRPAGMLIPDEDRTRRIAAGFDQIEAQVLRPGLYAEVTCPSLPLTVIPMVVVSVQEAVSTGQVSTSDKLVDIAQVLRTPGTILTFMEPLYEGGLDKLPLGAYCIANVYSNNHDRISSGEVSGVHAVALHVIDTLGLVHALILRAQTLLLPIRSLVLSDH